VTATPTVTVVTTTASAFDAPFPDLDRDGAGGGDDGNPGQVLPRRGCGPGTCRSRAGSRSSARGRRRSKPRLTRKLKISIESFNREMRKVLKTRAQFPSDDSAVKTLWLAILDTEEKRAEQRAPARPASRRASGTARPG
jgi:hypothetical protein